MRQLKKLCFISTLFILCLISTSFNNTIGTSISIEEAINQQLITYKSVNKGSHSGNCMDMEITNISKNKLVIKLESGRNLTSLDTNKQDILVVKEALFVLNPAETIKKEVFGFCSQSHKSAPSSGEIYAIGNLQNDTIIQLTTFLSKNNYPLSAMQNAIWSLTNNRPVASIFHENRDSIESLQAFVAQFHEKVIPWYSIQYMEADSGMVSNKASTIYGEFDARLDENTIVKIVIYDKYQISQVRKEIITSQKGNKHAFSITVQDLPSGRYEILFSTFGGRVDRKPFRI